MRKIFLVLALIVGLAGCAISHGRLVTEGDIAMLEIGKTTQAEVLGLLGEPTSKSLDASGKIMWGWLYTHSQANLLGLPSNTTATFSALFDENGILQSYMHSDLTNTSPEWAKRR